MFKKILIAIVVLGSALSAQAQYYSYKQHIQHADHAYYVGNYLEAMSHYNKAIEINNDLDMDVIYNYAESAYNTNSYMLADSLYSMLLDESNEYNPHDARYKIADMKMSQGKYEEAILDFDLYLSEYEDVDTTITNRVNFLKSSAEWATNQNVENSFFPSTTESGVNSPFSEHAPYVRGDSLYYNSMKFPVENDVYDRYTSKILLDNQVVAVSGLSENSIISHPSFTPDEKHVFFTVGEYVDLNAIRCDIYYAAVGSNGQIIGPTKLPAHINKAGYTSTHPSVSYDRDSSLQLLFVSDRAGGKGGLDIWSSKMTDDFMFFDPENLLGVNTEYNELSPFHHEESSTLYFSTDGREGFGGADIYQVGYDGFLNGDISNSGSNINSPNNDLYFFLTDTADKSYFASNRAGSQYIDSQFESCCYDIYSADAQLCSVELDLLVYDDITKELVPDVAVIIKDKNTDDVIYEGILTEDSMIEVPCSDDYLVSMSKPGYEDITFDLGPINSVPGSDNKYTKETYLKPLDYSLVLKVINGANADVITGATVYLTNKATKEVKELKANPGNVFSFALDPDADYLVEVEKDGFKESSFEFSSDVNQPLVERTIELRLLDKVEKALLSLDNAIPVSLYFDNDQPDPGTIKETSTKNYTQSYSAYYARKDKFKNVYISRSTDKIKANQEIEDLFENEIKIGFDKYETFKRQLLLVLENDQEVNVYLRGFASPVAASDYNTALGKRRIDSVRKEFYEWKGGALVPYIQSKQLIVTERSFGESTSPNNISDNANAPAKSIYSPNASRERRVEIDEIQFNQN